MILTSDGAKWTYVSEMNVVSGSNTDDIVDKKIYPGSFEVAQASVGVAVSSNVV